MDWEGVPRGGSERVFEEVHPERVQGEARGGELYQRAGGDAGMDQTVPVQIPSVPDAQKVRLDVGVHELGG